MRFQLAGLHRAWMGLSAEVTIYPEWFSELNAMELKLSTVISN